MSDGVIESVVERARTNLLEPPPEAIAASVESISSALPPYEWDKVAFENALQINVPVEDVTYGQWGLVIWGPDVAIDKQSLKDERRADFQAGDLLIGNSSATRSS